MVTMSAVWDRTTEFLADNFGAVAGIAALTLIVPGAVDGVLKPYAAVSGAGVKLGVGLLSLLVAVVGILGQGALTALALDPALGRGGALRTGLARFAALLGVSIVAFVGMVVLGLPILALLVAGGVDLMAVANGARPTLDPAMGLWIFLYALIALPLVIWLAARLAVVTAIVIGERRGLGAFGRSFALTRGVAARIAGAVVLLVVVGWVAALAAQTVFGSIFRLILGSENAINPAAILTAIVVATVSAGFSALLTAFLAKLYLALAARADAVPAAPAPAVA